MSLHARVTAETRGMIGAERIAAMPAGSVLVNDARGALLDHAALAAALRDGHLFAAGLDVFDVEPLPADHPLRDAPHRRHDPAPGRGEQGDGRAGEPDRRGGGGPVAARRAAGALANPDVLDRLTATR